MKIIYEGVNKMDESLIRKIVREELEKILQEKAEKRKITGMEFRVAYSDGGGWKIDRFTKNEEDALFHKKYLEAQGKKVNISVYSSFQEHSWDYDEFKRQMEEKN